MFIVNVIFAVKEVFLEWWFWGYSCEKSDLKGAVNALLSLVSQKLEEIHPLLFCQLLF